MALPINWEIVDDPPFQGVFKSPEELTAAWEDLKQRLPLGTILTGKIFIRAPFGVFYDAGKGFPVLINVPEFSGNRSTTFPNDYPKLNSSISGKLAMFDDDNYQLRAISTNK